MPEYGEGTLIRVALSGALFEFPPQRQPPQEILEKLPGLAVDSEFSYSFDAQALQTFAMSIPWTIGIGIASNALYDLGKWLFDRFRRPRETAEDGPGTISAEVAITVTKTVTKNGQTTTTEKKKTVSAEGPEELVKELLEMVGDDS